MHPRIAQLKALVLGWLEAQLTKGTQARYLRAREAFVQWALANEITADRLLPEELDIAVARFVLNEKDDDDATLKRHGV